MLHDQATRRAPCAARIVAAAALLLPACQSHAPAPPARLCKAPAALPGSVPFPDSVRSALDSTPVPEEAAPVPGTAAPASDDAAPGDHAACNRLALEPGAFARQHALDAIDWRSWSPETLAEAASLKRPLLVVTGFAACAACGFADDPSLFDSRVVTAINAHFVPVLVDRDERPDVDAYLMLATEVVTGQAGWPAAVFLQSDAKPFDALSWGAAATSEKKLSRFAVEVVRRIELGGGVIADRAEGTMEKLARRAALDTTGPVPAAAEVATALRGYVAKSLDAASASFPPPPLFPRAPLLDFLLRSAAGEAADGGRTAAEAVLAGLRVSALDDAVGGGFFRYARKAGWQEPSHEKLLADNAALASAYLEAAAATGREDLRAAAASILDFLLQDLRTDGGAFAASIDARSRDAAGEPCDGCYYAGLDDERAAALASPDAREKDRQKRASVAAPARNDVVLADANALAISALVRGAAVLAQPRYLDAAKAAASFLDAKLRAGGRVKHCIHGDGRSCAAGYLADQALVALAFVDLDAASRDNGKWLQAARAIADALPRDFEHSGSGGFFQTAADAEQLPLRLVPAFDGAVASGNSAAALLYTRLAQVTGDAAYADTARRTIGGLSVVLTLRPLELPQLALALENLENAGAAPRRANDAK
ncbi:MAG TPA: DUF255 domain-containing protein [Candidatus Binatia bacterium]|jgi:hypothetical protein